MVSHTLNACHSTNRNADVHWTKEIARGSLDASKSPTQVLPLASDSMIGRRARSPAFPLSPEKSLFKKRCDCIWRAPVAKGCISNKRMHSAAVALMAASSGYASPPAKDGSGAKCKCIQCNIKSRVRVSRVIAMYCLRQCQSESECQFFEQQSQKTH